MGWEKSTSSSQDDSNEFLGDKKKVVLALRLLHLPIILGLILSIVGGTRLSSSDSSKQSEGEKFEKAGGILYLIGYVGLFGIAVLTMARIRNLPSGEKRILLAVLAALPLLAVRLLYSLLADFANNSTFSILGGNATVQLCMAIIEEMIATIIFLAAGITAPSIKNVERGSDHMAMNQKPPPQYVHCTGTVSSTAGLMEGQ